MIDFACRKFSLEEVIRCGLSLTKAEFLVLSHMIGHKHQFHTSKELSQKLVLDLSTVQRTLKNLFEKKLLHRSQQNLIMGGYVYSYQIITRKELKDIVLEIIDNWKGRVEKEFEIWSK